ncbi:hypothetical protein PRZ48_006255 [Zasmidium cellare]|uniref:Uncharacterized protein n=1 Tax=Zasmidium cellare TaxID=395010 RepID=A0ABR0ENA2_ZASCE|nr:hypothetical protein PRZ48_006255 [Zasmidium cellare]
MLENQPLQGARNIFGLHGLHETLDPARLQLFLTLPILDHYGIPCCMHHTRGYATHYGWPSCSRPLKDTLRLCTAFNNFYLMAGDPAMRDAHDPHMINALVKFFHHACCEKHEGDFADAEDLAWRLLDDIKIWREKHLIPELQPAEEPSPPESLEPQRSRLPIRLSRFWEDATSLGSIRSRGKGRDRSASPDTINNDSSSTLRPPPKQIGRPVSSVLEMGQHDRRASHAGKVSLEGGREAREKGNRGRERKRDKFGFGSIVMAKLTVRN